MCKAKRVLKNGLGLPLVVLVVFFLGRASFHACKIDFRNFAVKKFIISSVYWLQLVIMELTMRYPVLQDLKKRTTSPGNPFFRTRFVLHI